MNKSNTYALLIMAAVFYFLFPAGLYGFETGIVFIPARQSFLFSENKFVDFDKGDIIVTPYGIETDRKDTEIAEIEVGFLSKLASMPDERSLFWTNFVEFTEGMIYALTATAAE